MVSIEECPGRILVTGAGGFVGRYLVPALVESGYRVIAATNSTTFCHDFVAHVAMPDLGGSVDWRELIGDADMIVHLAGIAHRPADDLAHSRINGEAVGELAFAALRAGVRHLVFVSSIAAQVGSAADGHVVTEGDDPHPVNAYGRAKLAGEQAVKASGVPFTILRPVVIAGARAKGNFGTLNRLVRARIPLPLGMLRNQRSILSVENFVSAVQTVFRSPTAIGQTYIVANPLPETVSDIVRQSSAMLGIRPIILPVPAAILKIGLQIIGRHELWDQLGRSLVVSSGRLQAIGWTPSAAPQRFSGP